MYLHVSFEKVELLNTGPSRPSPTSCPSSSFGSNTPDHKESLAAEDRSFSGDQGNCNWESTLDVSGDLGSP